LTEGSETVLVAEDDEAVRGLMKQILEQSGYKVLEAADGEDAVRKFRENGEVIDLLLFDVAMPGLDGKSAYEEIRKAGSKVKAVFISGYVSDDERSRKILEEGHTLIPKPISPRDLLLKIREAFQ
jgi:DNA-binding response OmpR family regulator